MALLLGVNVADMTPYKMYVFCRPEIKEGNQ